LGAKGFRPESTKDKVKQEMPTIILSHPFHRNFITTNSRTRSLDKLKNELKLTSGTVSWLKKLGLILNGEACTSNSIIDSIQDSLKLKGTETYKFNSVILKELAIRRKYKLLYKIITIYYLKSIAKYASNPKILYAIEAIYSIYEQFDDRNLQKFSIEKLAT